jgi:hypothetical protein
MLVVRCASLMVRAVTGTPDGDGSIALKRVHQKDGPMVLAIG